MIDNGSQPDRAFIFRDLDQVTDSDLEKWLPKIPVFRRKQAEHYHFRMDRIRSLATFLLLSFALEKMPCSFKNGRYGKPEPDHPDTPHFNMTHAGNCAAVAVSQTQVGIDAEELRSAPFDVMPRVFTPHEITQIESAANPDRAFFMFWTLKESYVKALGMGFSFPLLDVEFTVDVDGVRCSDTEFQFTLLPYDSCLAAVCGRRMFDVREVKYDELFGG